MKLINGFSTHLEHSPFASEDHISTTMGETCTTCSTLDFPDTFRALVCLVVKVKSCFATLKTALQKQHY